LLDTAEAAPSPGAKLDNQAVMLALAGGRYAVSDLYRKDGSLLIAVAVPLRGSEPAAALAAEIRPAALRTVLRRQNVPEDGVVTLVDANQRVIASTLEEEAVAGSYTGDDFATAAQRMNEGSWRGTLRGEAAYASLSRSPRTGWTVALEVPARGINALRRRSLTQMAGIGIAFLALGLVSSLLYGRQLTRALASGAAAATRLARGEPVDPQPSRIAEIHELAQRLSEAGAILAARQRERDQAAQRAEQMGRSKDEFLATVSHELRNPLNAILGWVRLLREGALDAPGRERALEVIERNTRLQSQLVEELLDSSRIVSGKLRLEMRPLDLQRTVSDAVEAIRPTAQAKEVRLQWTPEARAVPLLADGERLQQVLWNLLTNAVKFTPRGGAVTVRLGCAPSRIGGHDDEDAWLEVSDTGIGIEAALLPHVFERFRQGAPSASREQGGLGIGLALVRHLVELHGGSVAAASPGPGQGAVFTVRLPLAAERAVLMRGGLEPAAAAASEPAPSLDGVAVLVVDDDEDTRELLARSLRRAGARVEAASGAEEALTRLAVAAPDVLLSDIAMPATTGYDLIAAVRARPALRGLPSIALTAYGREEDRERALAAGFDLHLGKPVEPAALVRAVALLAARAPSP
jgi:signal transduction histidine kinase